MADIFKTIKISNPSGGPLQEQLVGVVSSFTGAADAGKIIALNASGQLDPTLVPPTGSVDFSGLLTGTNTTSTMTVGSGASIVVSGSGVVQATQIQNVLVSGTPSVGYVLTATSATAATWQSASGGVTSFNGRSGAVSPQTGDYTYAEISGTPQLATTFSPISNEFLTSYDASTGLFTASTVAYSGITGTPTLPSTITATTSNYLTSYNATTGLFTQAQPAFSDISGTVAVGQLSGTYSISISGNAATVTNGVYTTGSYSNPSWITSILGSIVSGNISGDAASITGTITYSQVTGVPAFAQTFTAVTSEWLNSYNAATGLFTATQPASTDLSDVALLAYLASPAFTGTPTAPTPATADSSTKIATTAYVQAQGYVTAATAPVTSVFGRTGAVTAQTGDYTYAQISGTPQLAQTFSAVSNEFLTAYNATTGLFTAAQPAYSGISGTPQLAQTFAAVSHEWLNSYSATTGLFTATQPASTDLSDAASLAYLASPTFTGTVTLPTVTLSGTMTVGTGASISVTGTGSVEATKVQGVTVSTSAPTSAGQVLTSTSTSAAAWQNPTGGGSLVGYRKTATHYLAGSAGPTAIQDTGAGIAGAQGAVTAVPSARQAAAYQYQSTAAATPAGYQSATNNTFNPWWFDGANISLFVDCYIGQTVTERVWIGMFDNTLSTATIFGSDTFHANQYVAFRYSTVAGDTAWQCVSCDGTTQNVVSSGVSVNTQSHRFVIVCNDSVPNVQYYIDGVLVATITTNTPTTSQVKPYMVVGLTSTVTVQSNIYFTQALIQQDY
jgi:hypothetical protein